MKPKFDDLTLTLLVGVLFAAFAAFVYVLQLPPDQFPTKRQIVGRVGTAMVGAFAVGWAVNHFWGWDGNAIYAVQALSGIFGDRIFLMISALAKSKGIPLEPPEQSREGGSKK